MNPSVTPLILPGLSLSWSSSSLASSSSKCAKCTAGFFRRGWLPFSFLRGKKLVVLSLRGTIGSLDSGALRQLYRIFLLSLPGGPQVVWVCSYLWTHLQINYHHLIAWEVCHRSSLSSTLQHNLGENDQGRKWLKPGDALKGECPSPTLFPYLPSVIGIAPGSAHQALSHCYSVHLRLSTHCPRLYPYWSSVLALQDSLARI